MSVEPYLVGYARASKGDEQSNVAQARALSAAGCKRMFEEAASGGRWDRPRFQEMISQLRDGDLVASGSSTGWQEGRVGGRRRKLGDKKRREIAESVISGRKSGAEMARLYDVSEPTVSRIVAEFRQQKAQEAPT